MTTTGVVGGRWRATVTEWGAIKPWNGSPTIDWFVAADDRWHVPQHETATRQTTVDGTPVVETRVRIPTGDAVQRVYSVADSGGMTIVEVTNDSTLPIAVAFTGGGLLSRRPASAAPVQGIELPTDTVMFPVGHRATVVVALPHDGAAALPNSVAAPDQVARGWLAQTQRASRLQLPEVTMVESVAAARCELLLNGPGKTDDPSALLLGIVELVRMGDTAAMWTPEIATQLERLARRDAALPPHVGHAVVRVLHAAGERRALKDLRRMTFGDATDADQVPDTASCVPSWVERRLVVSDEHSAQLMPHLFPSSWLGVDFEVHGLVVGLESALSFAVRWHGERPAVLWEVSGPSLRLSHGDWATDQSSGEALWSAVTADASSFS
jgi:hypothetical protein